MSIQNNDKSLIKQLLHSYHPLYITHNNYKYTIYNSTFNNTLYINITPLCKQFNITTHRFLRRKDTQNKINLENEKLIHNKLKSIYTHKNYGCWINLELFELFSKWLSEKDNIFNNFGIYIKNNIHNLNNQLPYNPYFLKIFKYHLRICKKTNFINITDISVIYDKDLRTFKKSNKYKDYIKKFPNHCLYNNNITDEFGIRVTLAHKKLALILLNYYKKFKKTKVPLSIHLKLVDFVKKQY